MAVTKITVSTAMRARDVSRPHDEHLAETADREEAATRRPEVPPAAPPPAAPPPAAPPPAAAAPSMPPAGPLPGPAGQGPPPSRRRRRRGR